MTEIKSRVMVGEFVDLEEAAKLLDATSVVIQQGGLSLHWTHCDRKGAVVLIQGSNGEFAVLSLPS